MVFAGMESSKRNGIDEFYHSWLHRATIPFDHANKKKPCGFLLLAGDKPNFLQKSKKEDNNFILSWI